MASELIVQNLKGPSSGSNANKILVPSGHTLDASDGTLVPSAGQILQVVRSNALASTVTASSTTFVTVISYTFTPKQIGSLFRVEAHGVKNYSGGASIGISGKILKDGSAMEPTGQTVDLLSYASGFSGSQEEYDVFNYIKYGTSTAASHTIKFQISKYSTAGNNANIQANWGTTRLTITEIAQ